ncbi:hypothetical protein, partial [Parvimonas sp. M13]
MAKMGIYYTFRLLAEHPLKVEAHKWEEFGDMPIATYVVDTGNPSNRGCSCPAFTSQCKHKRCVEEARERNILGELFQWKWLEKGGWQKTDDIRPIE